MKSQLTLETCSRGGRTILLNSYATPPLKIADITEDKRGSLLSLMVMSSSPGILDGDNLDLNLIVGENSHVQLSTQSYQRLFTMTSNAKQQLHAQLGSGAFLTYIPHPLVPHFQANFGSSNTIYLKKDSGLIWGDIITSGRQHKGESFNFTKIHLQTNIFIENKLAVKENMFLEPANTTFTSMGLWEGYSHQASLLCIHPKLHSVTFKDDLKSTIDHQKEILFGISSPSQNIVVVRILGNKGEQLYEILKKLEALFQTALTKEPAYAS